MLPYKKVIGRTFSSFKDKRTFVTALILSIPAFVYMIVSLILLNGFNSELNKVIIEMENFMMDSNNVITNTVLNGFLSNIIDVFINNIGLIIIDTIISLVASFISLLLTYVLYYTSYKIINKQEMDTKTMFSHLLGGIGLTLLYCIKIFLWSLLFIIPGIVKTFSYSLCFIIKIENPEMRAIDCIKKSKELMQGRRERLFIQYLFYILIMFIASIVVSNISMVFGLFMGIDALISDILSIILTSLANMYWAMNVCIYYNEVIKDEEYLSVHPELREMGISGVIKEERKRIRIEYGPNVRVEDPFKSETQTQFKDPYENNPFKQEKNNETKSDDPFED